jgi:hypothetical protein
LSIIDQFSHVCVYYHNGDGWEKHGFEGTMFLFERLSAVVFFAPRTRLIIVIFCFFFFRNVYPPYGLYIMNRAGRSDYVKHLYPEDDVIPSDKILIIRSYPDFQKARLTRLTYLHPGQDLDKFSDAYTIPDVDSKSKGRATFIGLWTFQDNSRDSLMEVMQR